METDSGGASCPRQRSRSGEHDVLCSFFSSIPATTQSSLECSMIGCSRFLQPYQAKHAAGSPTATTSAQHPCHTQLLEYPNDPSCRETIKRLKPKDSSICSFGAVVVQHPSGAPAVCPLPASTTAAPRQAAETPTGSGSGGNGGRPAAAVEAAPRRRWCRQQALFPWPGLHNVGARVVLLTHHVLALSDPFDGTKAFFAEMFPGLMTVENDIHPVSWYSNWVCERSSASAKHKKSLPEDQAGSDVRLSLTNNSDPRSSSFAQLKCCPTKASSTTKWSKRFCSSTFLV